MAALLDNLKIAGTATRLLLQKQLEFPTYLAGWALMIPLQYVSAVLMLKVLIANFRPLAGWNFGELAFLYGLGALSHSFAVLFFLPLVHFDEMIIRGDLDRLLLRPAGVFFQFCVQSPNILGLLDVLVASVVLALSAGWAHLEASPLLWLQVLAVTAGATLIRGAVYLGFASVAFWTTRSRALVLGGFALLDRTTAFPLAIYPSPIQWVLTLLVPVAFINYLPAAEMLGKGALLGGLPVVWLLTLGLGIVCFTVSYSFFRWGLRRYEGAGN